MNRLFAPILAAFCAACATTDATPSSVADAGAPDARFDSSAAAQEDAALGDAGEQPSSPTTTFPDGPTGEALDPVRGVLNVDYASYLAKHDIVYARPNTNPLYGLTVGSGRVGAMVWSANGLSMQIGGVDASPQAAFSAGLATLATSPSLENAKSFTQRLRLWDGTLETTYDADRTVTVFGVAKSEMLGIHVEDTRANVDAVTFDLGIWDVSALGNSGNVRDLDTWKKVTLFADAGIAGFSRGQSDPDAFGYTLAATVEGTAFTTSIAHGHALLTLTPSKSYTIWITAASRVGAPNHDSVALAKKLLADVKSAGYAATAQASKDFWHEQWAKSFVHYSDAAGEGDYIENVYYLTTYILLSGAFGHYPFHFINGVFRATGDDTKWSNAYWYWNQRDVYNSLLASNHADAMRVFNDMYSRNAAALKALTQTRYGADAIWVPETMGWNGSADGTVGSDYTKNILSTGTEAAENMLAYADFTGDADYLQNTAYPFARDVAALYLKKLTKDASGQYGMTSSNAHETYWNVPNAITDLAAVRSLFPRLVALSTTLGVDADRRAQWQDVLDHLVAYPTDAKTYLPHQPPLAQTRNGENVACELIWPYSVTGIEAPDYDRAAATWRARPFPYGNVWANDAIQAARLGLGDEAKDGMKTMLVKYQNYPNGFTNNTNGVFEYLGVNLSAMNESLLQSHDGVIRVFPAIPSDGSFRGRFTLAAKGGFLVSAEHENGTTKYVALKSLRGGTVTVANPWKEPVEVRYGASLVRTSSDARIPFATGAGGLYVLAPAAKPLASYTYAFIGGSRNDGPKTLGASSTSLGLSANGP